jgi:hypothetical protein
MVPEIDLGADSACGKTASLDGVVNEAVAEVLRRDPPVSSRKQIFGTTRWWIVLAHDRVSRLRFAAQGSVAGMALL